MYMNLGELSPLNPCFKVVHSQLKSSVKVLHQEVQHTLLMK